MHIGTIVTHIRDTLLHRGERAAHARLASGGAVGRRDPVPRARVAALVRDARRVLLVSPLPLADDLWAWLRARPSLTEGVWIICPAATDPGAILPLVEAGFRVSCVRDIDVATLILDNQIGFTLPECRPLDHAGEIAERWRLRQLGLYTLVAGTLWEYQVEQSRFRLYERPDIWFNVPPGAALPPPGAAVTVLAHWMPWSWRGDHLLLTACCVRHERTDNGSFADRPGRNNVRGVS
jgi:hypothetical protein